MKKKMPWFAKYYWDLSENAIQETWKILKNSTHAKFMTRAITLLSRCQDPKLVFRLIPKKQFVEVWPKIRREWTKLESRSQFRDWWQTIYEQMIGKAGPEGKPPVLFLNIGRAVRGARVRKGLSQKDLAQLTGINQPDISKIEEGRKNITLRTLFYLSKALSIKKIDLA